MKLKDLVVKILVETAMPMTSEEIWKYALERKYDQLVNVKGKTPWNTISAQIYVDMKEEPNSNFIKVGRRPVKFSLANLEQNKPEEIKLFERTGEIDKRNKYTERDLHKVFSYFAYNYMRIYTKTIFHEKSKKKDKGANEWLHPDLVGFYFPLKDWEKQVLELSNNTGSTPIRLYSFEIKKELDFRNIRAAFFQTVSNSSWANESYLVAAEISNDNDFLDELRRLSVSFGIGIIRLNLQEPDDSSIIYPAKYKTELDWDTINKLLEENPDFKEFISDINACITSNRIYDTAYDEIYDIEDLKSYFNI
ncbi:MAG: HrgA protein [Candidatus Cellulosilyticum pullistercoris]|uniref:HrgA protein n=1 Tax=Candidatus Cellulosilyticum pullistercoris TaxID=2838521 RepID=A0A9E2KAJ6_9FIRM|nr:HrgA protein [Candidatus Cellulosilyticum pullistercoris]